MTNTDDIDDVLAAADTIDNRLPHEQPPRTAWVSFEERLDETMRNKLKMLRYGNEVV